MGSSRKRLPAKWQLSAVAEIVPLYEGLVTFVRKVQAARRQEDEHSARQWRVAADRTERQIRKMHARYRSGSNEPNEVCLEGSTENGTPPSA